MKITRRSTLFLAICMVCTNAATGAEPRPASRNVVSVTADGVRWQEVFRGAEEELLNEKDGGVANVESLRRDFCAATLEAIWMAVIGPNTPSLGERTNTAVVTKGQVAATIAALLGEDYAAEVPNAANPVGDMIAPPAKTVETPAAQTVRRIAFGSCATQARPQPIWNAVVATRPELVLLLGDSSKLKRKTGPRNPSDPYERNPDPTTTILGADQWRWLGEQLHVPAEVRLLVSSIQVVPEDHGFEKWMNFPHERERLFTLIRETGADGVIILSGDRHLAELSMMNAQVGYPIYDLTSSGFNQASHSWRPLETNRHRVATMNWGDNFGVITIDWDQPDPRISMQIRDVDGDITIQQKIRLSTIRRKRGEAR